MFKSSKKIISLICLLSILCVSLSPFFTRKAEAQWAVWEMNPAVYVSATLSAGANTTNTFGKEFGLDTLAWMVANIVIEEVAASTIDWINTGFRGSPAFLTDPGQYFTNLADGIAGEIINNHPDFAFMCAPFKARVQIALTQNYRQHIQFQCTLSGVVNNFNGFMSDFNQGGWDGFIEITQNSQNNPMGLYNIWNNELYDGITSAAEQKQNELNQGNGFLSYKRCTLASSGSRNDLDPNGIQVYTQDTPANCARWETVTPGSVIETQLNDTLGSGAQRLRVADEANEILSALFSQLTKRIVGGIGAGLKSLSESGSGTNNSGTYSTQLQTATENDAATRAAMQNANSSIANQAQQQGALNNAANATPTNTCVVCQLLTGGQGVRINGGLCEDETPQTQQTCQATSQTGLPGGSTGGGTTGGGTGGTSGGTGGTTGGTTSGGISSSNIPLSTQVYTFPIAAPDGSNVVGRPADLDCLNKDMNVIISQATAIKNLVPNPVPGSSIADIVRVFDCNP